MILILPILYYIIIIVNHYIVVQHAIIAQHHSVMLLLTVAFVQMCEVLEAKTTTSVGEFSILSNFEVHHSIGDIGVDAMRQLSSLFNHYLNSRFEKN